MSKPQATADHTDFPSSSSKLEASSVTHERGGHLTLIRSTLYEHRQWSADKDQRVDTLQVWPHPKSKCFHWQLKGEMDASNKKLAKRAKCTSMLYSTGEHVGGELLTQIRERWSLAVESSKWRVIANKSINKNGTIITELDDDDISLAQQNVNVRYRRP